MGHAAGDEVLRTIASRLSESFRTNDFIARIGGDEFVVLLEVDPAHLNDVEPTLIEAMDRIFKPIAIEGAVVELGAAVGVSHFIREARRRLHVSRQADRRAARTGLAWTSRPCSCWRPDGAEPPLELDCVQPSLAQPGGEAIRY